VFATLVDVNEVENFSTVVHDVRVNKGAMFSSMGFTEAAVNLAKKRDGTTVEPGALQTRNRKQSLKTGLLMGKRAQRIPSWPGVINSNKGRIHLRRPTCHSHFSLVTKRRTIHSGSPTTRDIK
jgi:hypothetical protein